MPERGSKLQGCQSSEQIWNFFGRIQMISCRARLLAIDENWLYHYYPETKQQSIEWRHSGSPRPKKISRRKSAGKVLASIFWDQDDILHIDYPPKAKLSTRIITHLCWCNWRTFWRKNAVGNSPGGSCSCTTMSRLTGHLQPRRNWPTWTSSVLTTHPILRIWPRRTTTCSLDWKNNWNVTIFSPDS